jgi:hypothetical protein
MLTHAACGARGLPHLLELAKAGFFNVISRFSLTERNVLHDATLEKNSKGRDRRNTTNKGRKKTTRTKRKTPHGHLF